MAENEEDLSQKDPNQPQLYQVRDKQVNQLQKKQKVHRVLLTLKLLERRKAMLVYSHSGRLTSAAITELAKTFECSEKTLLNDWAKREIWEPFIWAQEKASDDGREDLRKLEFALEEAFYMMKTCRHPLARVGAIARYAWIVKTIIELKQSLGILPRVNMAPTMIQQNNMGGSAALMIKGVFWENPELKSPEEGKKDEKTV